MSWPQAVIFDLDGTLMDSAPAIAEAINQVRADRGGPPVGVDLIRKLVSRGVKELLATSLGTFATTPENDIAAFRAIYGELPPRAEHLYPGAAAMLHKLHSQGIRLGICTNKPQALTERILTALGLIDCFAAVLGGDACARVKPHPDHVHETLARMGVSPAAAVFVGDSEVDGEAAAAAGLPFILVTFGYAIGNMDEIVHSVRIDNFDDLPDALHEIVLRRDTRDRG